MSDKKTASIFDGRPVTDLTDEELQKRAIGYASQVAALTSKFLDHVAEFDARKMWVGTGIYSCAHWLSWFTGLSLRTAQDHVRVAKSLRDAPLLHQFGLTGGQVCDPGQGADATYDADREAHLDAGPALDDNQRDEARCGATVRTVGHHKTKNGPTLWWSKKRRVPNAALVRVVTMRDRTGRHPGCGRTRYLHLHLHLHHVTFWSHHGTTDPDNLILLCSEHHRALRNGAFSIEALGLQQFRFTDQQGRVLLDAPPTRAPGGWVPDPDAPDDGVVAKQGGRLDLHYAVEVLYARWAWQARHAAKAEGLVAVA